MELSGLPGAVDATPRTPPAASSPPAAGANGRVTLGEQGALLGTAKQAWRGRPMRIEVVSTVGAGDSFLGGLVAALSAGKSMPEAFRVAVAAGSAAVMSPGTELCSAQDVQRLLSRVKISEFALALS